MTRRRDRARPGHGAGPVPPIPYASQSRRAGWLLSGAGLLCLVLLTALKIVTEGDAFSLLDLVVDVVSVLLTIAACVAVLAMARSSGGAAPPDDRRGAGASGSRN